MKRSNASLFIIVFGLLLIAVLSAALVFVYTGRSAESAVDVSPLEELAETIRSQYYFYDDKELSDEKLVEAAMRGMVSELDDPYAEYYTQEEYDELLSENAGDYVGVGMTVTVPDDTGSTVVNVYADGPADQAGIRSGDVITVVNGTSTANLTMDEMLALFSDDDDTPDSVTYLRDGVETTVSLTRAEVHITRVTSTVYRGTIGYIHITEFNGSVATDFWDAAVALRDQGIRSLIIDLRNDPGGGLSEVLAVANHLIPEGNTIVTIRSKSGDETVYSSEGDEQLDMNLAVLVNGDSASASELLTGALKDYGLATIVGTQTYGKGIVQSFYRLENNGGWVKFTTDAYYTPNGTCIQGVGITPDIVVDLPEELQSTSLELLDPDEDTQLQAAIRSLLDGASTSGAATR